MSAGEEAPAGLKPYDCKIQSISDLAARRALAILIRRDKTGARVALSAADLEYWAAFIAAILVKADEI